MKNKIMRTDEIVEGRFFTHESEERDVWKTAKWRLRDLQHHPIDPNWENGKYVKCHTIARKNDKLKLGTIIFDLVGIEGHGNSRFIRSAFVINKKTNGILNFDSFFFCDETPLKSPKKITRTSFGVLLKRNEAIRLLNKMKKNHYNEYKVGKKPKSINKQEWNYMKRLASKHVSKRHVCKL